MRSRRKVIYTGNSEQETQGHVQARMRRADERNIFWCLTGERHVSNNLKGDLDILCVPLCVVLQVLLLTYAMYMLVFHKSHGIPCICELLHQAHVKCWFENMFMEWENMSSSYTCEEDKEQLSVVRSCLSSCETQRLVSGPQAWCQAHLSVEPSLWP